MAIHRGFVAHTCPLSLCTRLASISLPTAIAVAATAGGPYTFTNIADNTGPLGNSFNVPSINNDGYVVFAASIGGGDTGIFVGNGGPLTTIVLGGDDNFNVSTFTGINNSNFVAYRVADSVSEHTLYLSDGGVPTIVANNSGAPFIVTELPTINDANAVAFYGNVGGGVTGIYRAASFGNYTTIADTSGDFVTFAGRASLNDNGVAAFNAGTSTGSGIYIGDGGPLTTIVTTGGPFTSVGNMPSLNNNGTVGFFAGNVNVQGIYTGNGGPLTLIADTTGPYQQFSLNDPAINNHGDVAFLAGLDAGGKGIFTGPDPVADKVIQTGDPLFDSTLTGLATLIEPHSINDSGDICFIYFLNDGRTGVAVAKNGNASPPNPDLDDDGTVGVSDLLLLLNQWGPCLEINDCPADLDGDGAVGVSDLLILLASWG